MELRLHLVSPVPMISRSVPVRRTLLFAVALLAASVGSGGLRADAQSDGSDGGPLKEQYDEVLGQEASLVATIDASTKKREGLLLEIAAVSRRLDETTLQMVAAERSLEASRRADDRAHTELVAARRRVAKATRELNAQAVSTYIHGGTAEGALAAMVRSLQEGDIAGPTLSYADAVIDHQRAVVKEFRSARADRDRKSRAAASSRSRATEVRDLIGKAKANLQIDRVRVQVLSDESTREYLVQQVALGALRAKKLEIETRIVALEKESDGIALTLASLQGGEPDYTPGSIVFSSPIPGASIGSPFGMRFHPILHYTRLHAGTDLTAGSGTPIHAAADGLVIIAGPRGGYGNATVIDHGSSIATVYAHQSVINVRVGQAVKAGDVIGQVGTTGLSTGPHLHFETRLRGTPVNPVNFITF